MSNSKSPSRGGYQSIQTCQLLSEGKVANINCGFCHLNCEKSLPVAETTICILQLLATPQYLLLGVFIVTAVPLANIPGYTGGSNANISALLVWLGWAYICGIAVPAIAGSVFYNCTNFNTSQVSMVMS